MMKILGIGNMCLIFCILLTICLLVLGSKLPTDKELLEKEMSMLMKPLDSQKGVKNVEMEGNDNNRER